MAEGRVFAGEAGRLTPDIKGRTHGDLIDWAALGVKADLRGLGSLASLLCVTYPAGRLGAVCQSDSFQKGGKHKFGMFPSWAAFLLSGDKKHNEQHTPGALFNCMCDQLVVQPVSGGCCSDTRNV